MKRRCNEFLRKNSLARLANGKGLYEAIFLLGVHLKSLKIIRNHFSVFNITSIQLLGIGRSSDSDGKKND